MQYTAGALVNANDFYDSIYLVYTYIIKTWVAPCETEVSDMGSFTVMLYLSNSTTNPGQPWLPNNLLYRGPLRGYLAARGCPGYLEELNNYSITEDDPMLLTSLLHEAPDYSRILYPEYISFRKKKRIPMFS